MVKDVPIGKDYTAPVKAEESVNLEYAKYFKEYVPYTAKTMKHTYTVEITRAMFNEESHKVYLKYEKSIHKKNEN